MVLRRSLIILIAIILPAAAFAANKYVVKKGDNLYDLSRKFGISVDDIKAVNHLKDNGLDIGDELIIPDSNNSSNLSSITNGTTNEYIVKEGDTLGEIAGSYGVSIEGLKNANKLKTSKLKIGQKLLIPARNNHAVTISETETIIEAASKAASENLKPEKPTEEPPLSPREYAVQKGETLGHIAIKFNVSSREIRETNGLRNDKLQIGQILKIPSSSQNKETSQPTVNTENTPDVTVRSDNGIYGIYIVEKGDTPGTIAEKLGVSTDDLIKLNNLNSRNLQIGQKITVPGYRAADEKPDPEPESKDVDESARDQKAADTAAPPEHYPEHYIVRKGDTPSEIAEKLGVSTDDLIKLNNLKSRSLQIGQKLAVPGANSPDAMPGNLKADAANEDVEDARTKISAAKTEAPSKTLPSEYTVQKGDNLYDISRKLGTTVDYIKKRNNLKGNNLRIGQKLVLDTQDTTETPSAKTEKPGETVPASKYTATYTVRKGDTIGHLAMRFRVSQSELKNVNGLRNNDLKIGQQLKVPGTEKKEIIVVRETAPETVNEIYIKKRYVVKAGDTLSGIASSFGVTVDEVKKASALKNDIINTGDILLIPVPQEKVTTSKYTVAAGDTMGKIGNRFGVSVRELKDANGITSDKIWVGMKLNIPGVHSTGSSPATANEVVATPAARGKYVVKRGDTLGKIANTHGVSVTELKRENNIRGNMIRVGQVLTIPDYTKQETTYIAVTDKSIQNSKGHNKYSETEVKNGRFSKESIIQVAKKYLGAPYKFGGYDFTTGIDCSGYVKKIFSRFNVELPRTARDIYYKSGNKIAKSQLDSGDLVFFQTYAKYPSHVGIYIGNDEFIHASSASKMVTINNINKSYYRKRYIGAKRIQLSGLFYDEYSKDYRGFEN